MWPCHRLQCVTLWVSWIPSSSWQKREWLVKWVLQGILFQKTSTGEEICLKTNERALCDKTTARRGANKDRAAQRRVKESLQETATTSIITSSKALQNIFLGNIVLRHRDKLYDFTYVFTIRRYNHYSIFQCHKAVVTYAAVELNFDPLNSSTTVFIELRWHSKRESLQNDYHIYLMLITMSLILYEQSNIHQQSQWIFECRNALLVQPF